MRENILVYGTDALFCFSTRRQILEKSGYRVFTTMEFADAMMVLLNQRISVLVLCHSLRYDERYGWRLPEHFCRI